jgi:hypothetical protein
MQRPGVCPAHAPGSARSGAWRTRHSAYGCAAHLRADGGRWRAGLVRAVTGIAQQYVSSQYRGVLVQRRMRMILIPLAVAAAAVIMAVTRRPGKVGRPMGNSK